MEEATERYKDMDSVEPNAPRAPSSPRYSDVTGTVTNKDVPLIEAGLVLGNSGDGLRQRRRQRGRTAAPTSCSGFWKFNTKGWVEAEMSMKFNDVLIPRELPRARAGRLLQGGSLRAARTSAAWGSRSRFSMYADPWNMEDGADATIRGRRAGAHRGPRRNAARPLQAGGPDGVPRRAQQAGEPSAASASSGSS